MDVKYDCFEYKRLNYTKLVWKSFWISLLSLVVLSTVTITASIENCPKSCECEKLQSFVKFNKLYENCIDDLNNSIVLKCKINNTITGLPANVPTKTKVVILDGSSKDLISSIQNQEWHKKIYYFSYANSKIQNIRPKSMESFSNVRCIDLKENSIHSKGWVSGLVPTSQLEKLVLNNNHIHRLNESSFTGMFNLRSLFLSYNFIVNISPFTFEDLSNLEYLDLTGNALSTGGLHSASLFGLSSLTYLAMGENQIFETIPQVAAKGLYTSKLKTLDLHGISRLSKVSRGSLKDLPQLKVLNLSACSIFELEKGWLEGVTHQNLEVLDLSKNPLIRLEAHSIAALQNNMLSNLSNLKWVSFSGCHSLSTMDGDTFNFVPSLKYLFLQNCNISRMNLAANDPLNPNTLNLLTTLPNINSIWVHGNPLICNCHLYHILQFSLPPALPVCHTDILRGTSNCENVGENQIVRTEPMKIDPSSYEWKNKLINITTTETVCYQETKNTKVELRKADLELLQCEMDKVTVLVSIVLGPLAFAAAILVAFICGFFRTLALRFRLYNSNTYRALDRKKGLLFEMKKMQSRETPLSVRKSKCSNLQLVVYLWFYQTYN